MKGVRFESSREIRIPNLLICSQTRYRSAVAPTSRKHVVFLSFQAFLKNRGWYLPAGANIPPGRPEICIGVFRSFPPGLEF